MSALELKEVDFDKLKFIRVFTPMHVPRELIEQVRDREYEVEDWYKYQEIICLRKTDEGLQLNPLSMLYVIADEGNIVVGMLWCEIDALGKTLVVQTFSMDKKYWLRGKAVTLVSNKAKEIAKECKLKTIKWITSYPKHSERYGFRRSRSTIMEWQEDEDIKKEMKNGFDNDGKCKAQRGCSLDDPRTERLPESTTTGVGGTVESSDATVLTTV